jgi:tetratricopeptide (TPR) repeat protein
MILRFLHVGAATIAVLTLATTSPVVAQGSQPAAPEFTRQGLLVVNFAPVAGADMKMARRAADGVRTRLTKLVNNREVDVIDGDEVTDRLTRAGFNPDTTFELADLRSLGRSMRADEFIRAKISNTPSGPRISGEIVLLRDERMRQPLRDALAPRLDSAAALFAAEIVAARRQLVPERRCENALREGSGSRALATAREGVKAYPHSVIARTCLIWALRQTAAPATTVLAEAREILGIDPQNPHGLEAAAVALDSLRRRGEAADLWLELAATDTADLDLAVRVSYSLIDGGNATRAEPFLSALSAVYPDDIRFTQQMWRAAYENKNWPRAIGAGEALLTRDSLAVRDSVFYLKLGMAYRAAKKPAKALETLAHAVAQFPGDTRVYSLYAQYVKSEADSVVPRGLAVFPRSADLLAMSAKDLRARGKLEESLGATKMAVALDSTISQGQLMVAQLEIELGRPDSALVSLRRALLAGEDTSQVAQFALSKGNTLYRAASATKTIDDFNLARRMLAFADSARPSQQAKFLVGAAALGEAQAALAESAKQTDKSAACRFAQLGNDLVPTARGGLHAGEELFAEPAKQSLDFLLQLEPYAQQQVKSFCQ